MKYIKWNMPMPFFNTSNILTMLIVPKININSKMMIKSSQNVNFQHFNCVFLVIFLCLPYQRQQQQPMKGISQSLAKKTDLVFVRTEKIWEGFILFAQKILMHFFPFKLQKKGSKVSQRYFHRFFFGKPM